MNFGTNLLDITACSLDYKCIRNLSQQRGYTVEAQSTINVGERIKSLRAAKSMSLRMLSQKSGISANALSLIERSKTSPTVSTLMAIAKAFNLRVNDFFSDED